ncbi:hypothetical protein NW758_015116 [Fusarium oxysporum]|nr:hypothetical protein NW758_015116 [Fusarium oxysporum]
MQSSTTEKRYKPGPGRRARMVWLQKTQTVNDQHFGSYAIFAADDRELITTSHRAIKGKDANDAIDGSCEGGNCAKLPSEDAKSKAKEVIVKPLSYFGIKAVIGTAISLCGFIVQFIGLRGMHWSASIAQLLAVLIMMAFRALVRRGLATPPECIMLTSGFELDWFATTLGDIDNAPWMAKRVPDINTQTRKAFRKWTVRTGKIAQKHNNESQTDQAPEPNSSNSKANNVVSSSDEKHLCSNEAMKLRRNLGRLADWRGPASEEAISVARAIEITMDTLFGISYEDSLFRWSLCAQFGGLDSPVNFELKRQESGKWKAYSDEIEASLSLWLYSVNDLEEKEPQAPSVKPSEGDDGDDAWHRAKGSTMKRSLRLLGLRTRILDRSLEWWMPNEAPSILNIWNDEEILTEVEGHRIVGSGVHYRFEDNNPSLGPSETEITSTTSPEPIGAEMSHADNVSTGANEDSRKMLLVTESYSPLKLLYAQDIFSVFMWTAARLLPDPMPGAAEIRPIDDASGADSWKSFKLRNSQLSKMVQDIQTTGLGTAADVYLSVIPPLGVRQKLPEAEAIIRLARDHAKRYEQVGQLEEAGRIYEWLFQTVTVLQPESRVCVRATAVLMEHLRQLTLTIELKTLENDGEDVGDLESQKSKIEEHVRDGIRESRNTAVFAIVSNLMKMYKIQGRGWKCGLTQEDRVERRESDMEDSDVNQMFRSLKNIPYLGLTELHQVATYGPGHGLSLDETKKAVIRAESMNCRDVMDWTPLHYAAAVGSGSVYNNEMDTTASDLMGWTPLHYACLRGHEWMALTFIGQGAEINSQGRDGKAPLHCATMGGHLDLVKLLVEAGAVIDLSDAFWTTPLLWAARKGYESVVDYLWPDTSHKLRDNKGRTPLHLAVAAGKDDMVKTLLNQEPQADREVKDRNGQAPLHYAVERGQCNIVELLIENGANKDIQDRGGETPLHYAVWRGHEAMVNLLIKANVNMESRSNQDMTPLHLAVSRSHQGIVRLLIDAGADKEARWESGLTPLFYAARFGRHEPTLRTLLDAGANTEARDKEGLTVLHHAAQDGSEAIVRLLIDAGADKEARDEEGSTPLNSAVKYRRENAARVLIDAGADKVAEDKGGLTPLHGAAKRGLAATLVLLLDAGANKEARTKKGLTPLHSAVENGQEAVVKLLIDAGADAEARDNEGLTPLYVAVVRKQERHETWLRVEKEYNREEWGEGSFVHKFDPGFKADAAIVKLLIDVGSDKDAATTNGSTPRRAAARSLNPYIRRLLDIEEGAEVIS